MDDRKNKKAIREWIIFALCLGLGAHVTLGLVMHDVQAWPAQTYGIYGVLISLGDICGSPTDQVDLVDHERRVNGRQS